MATIVIPDSMNVPKHEVDEFNRFLQRMTNRRAVGHLRYGQIDRRQKYMTRLEKELKAYKKLGNMEQLLNIAVYCFLESYAPENKNFHHDAFVGSVTRKSVRSRE